MIRKKLSRYETCSWRFDFLFHSIVLLNKTLENNKKGREKVITDEEYTRMAKFETNHWWYKTLHYSIYKVILDSFSKNKNIRILDAGCGTGGTQLYLKRKGYHNIYGFDISKHAVDICKKRKLDVFQEDIRNINKRIHENSLDVIICSDILYFLDFDEIEGVLQRFFTLLKNNGTVIINLPALRVFRGTHDIVVGIKHRFSKRLMKALFSSTEFYIREMYYWPFLLSPFILLVRLFQKLKMFFIKDMNITSDLRQYSDVINSVLYGVNKMEKQIFKNMRFFGSSVFVCAQKQCD